MSTAVSTDLRKQSRHLSRKGKIRTRRLENLATDRSVRDLELSDAEKDLIEDLDTRMDAVWNSNGKDREAVTWLCHWFELLVVWFEARNELDTTPTTSRALKMIRDAETAVRKMAADKPELIELQEQVHEIVRTRCLEIKNFHRTHTSRKI